MKIYCSECNFFYPAPNDIIEMKITNRYKHECRHPNNLGTWHDKNKPRSDPWVKNYYMSCNWFEKQTKEESKQIIGCGYRYKCDGMKKADEYRFSVTVDGILNSFIYCPWCGDKINNA